MLEQSYRHSVEKNEVVVIENMQNLCRTCLVSDSLHVLDDLEYKKQPFIRIFSDLTGIVINVDDDMPKKICEICLGKIIQYHEFRTLFIHSQKLLETLSFTIKEGRLVKLLKTPFSCIIERERKKSFHSKVGNNVEYGKSESDEVKLENTGSEIDELDQLRNISQQNETAIFQQSQPQSKCESLPKIFRCNVCSESFTIVGIKNHKCTTCAVCRQYFKCVSGLQTHMNSHLKKHKCEICDKDFSNKRDFTRHKRVQCNERPFKCKFCAKNYKYGHDLKIHMKDVHSETWENNLCAHCGEAFDTYKKYVAHVEEHQNENFTDPIGNGIKILKEETQIEKSETFLCEICSKIYRKKNDLKVHLLEHGEKKFHCTVCAKKLISKSTLIEHMKIHSDVKKYMCQFCGRSFKYGSALRCHLKSHTGYARKYKCPICAKGYPSKYKLQGHMRSHTGEKPFPCLHCGRFFAQPQYLKVHERLHRSEKKYDYKCDEKFPQKSVILRHKLKTYSLE